MDYYEILGLKKDATENQVKKAYYKLAREYHPDKVESDKREEATKKFQEIGEAYEILSDSEKRNIYDQFGKEGLTQGGNPDVNPYDIFSQMFGQNFGFNMNQNMNRNVKRKNKETVFPLNISLTNVYKGLTKKLKVSRKVVIDKTTNEKIDIKDYETTWKKCDTCRGNGAIMKQMQIGPGMFTQTQSACDSCKGKGHMFLPNFGLLDISEIIQVDIPKGVENGKQILFENLGNASAGFLPGDLWIIIQTSGEEKGYIRKNNNLIYHKKIKLNEALCGTSFILKSLDDRDIKISYSDVITPGEKRIVKNEGIDGDLIIIFEIIFPKNISKENKNKLKKIL